MGGISTWGAEMSVLLVFVLVVAAWGFGAIFATRRARERGVPEWQIWAGVILLGPFCPLIAFIGNPSAKKCAFCMSVIDKQAKVCPQCRRDQVDSGDGQARTPQ